MNQSCLFHDIDGVDFTAATNDVILQPLTSRICTEFTIINDNLAEAQTETFVVTFANISNLQVGTNDRATVSIIDSYGEQASTKIVFGALVR